MLALFTYTPLTCSCTSSVLPLDADTSTPFILSSLMSFTVVHDICSVFKQLHFFTSLELPSVLTLKLTFYAYTPFTSNDTSAPFIILTAVLFVFEHPFISELLRALALQFPQCHLRHFGFLQFFLVHSGKQTDV